MLAVHDSYAASVAVTARLSSLGYSGEHFDAKTQQQYLRARFYDPANGRFNRLDPYAGKMQDPQSLHKYAYVHGDPIGNIDPSGMTSIGEVSLTNSMSTQMKSSNNVAIGRGLHTAHKSKKLLDLFNKFRRGFDKAEDAMDTIQSIIDWMDFDLGDLKEAAEGLLGVENAINSIASGTPPPYRPITIKLPKKVVKKVKVLMRWAGRNDKTTEIFGEIATGLAAYFLGFSPVDLRFHSVHGPDQVGMHRDLDLFGIFEAKGGRSGLARGSRAASYGDEMGHSWIKYSVDRISKNASGPFADGRKKLGDAADSNDPMVAGVSRFKIDGVRFQFKMAVQMFRFLDTNSIRRWRGFY